MSSCDDMLHGVVMAVDTICFLYQLLGLFAYIKIVYVQIVLPYDDIEEVSNCESFFFLSFIPWVYFRHLTGINIC